MFSWDGFTTQAVGPPTFVVPLDHSMQIEKACCRVIRPDLCSCVCACESDGELWSWGNADAHVNVTAGHADH